VGHILHFGAFGVRNVITLFFMLGWEWYGFDKKHARRRYAKLVFLHPVGSLGQVRHFAASGMGNMIALFFMLGWD
jgi:hypothetical protein